MSTNDPEQFKKWFDEKPNCLGYGIVPELSNLSVADVDTKNDGVGDQTRDKLVGDDVDLLNTVTVRTASGGWHYIYQGKTWTRTSGLGTNLDLIGGTTHFVGPGSVVHNDAACPSGIKCWKGECEDLDQCKHRTSACEQKLTCKYTGDYNYKKGRSLHDFPKLPAFPKKFLDAAAAIKKTESKKGSSATGWRNGTDPIPQGQAHNALLHYAGVYRKTEGLEPDKIFEKLKSEVASRCERSVNDADIRKIADDAGKWEKGQPKEDGQVARLITACEEHLTLFHTSDNETCASLDINGVRHTYRLDSREFRRTLSWILRQASDKKEAPTEKTVSSVLPYLQSEACFGGALQEVFLRVAGDAQTWIEIDIGDDTWTSVQINKKGWKIAPHTVRFVRSSSMKALPLPIKGGTIDELRRVIGNIKRDAVWALLVAYIVSALQPPNHGTYPILVVEGSEGSGKSELVKFLKKLIDPSRAKVRNLPHEQRDMPAAVYNNYCLAYENVSSIPQWLSDAWSSLATGDGFASRLMRTNKEEDVIEAHRPIMCNGITKFVTRADLLSRCVFIPLDPFTSSDVKRLTKDDLYAAQDEATPRILGAIYSLMAHVLAQRKAVHKEIGAREKPRHRLPEFEEIAHCIESKLDIPIGIVDKALSEGERLAALTALDSSVGDAIRELLKEEDGEWHGLSRDFYKALTAVAQKLGGGIPPKTWPKDAERLSNEIKRLEKSLTYAGVDYMKKPHKKGAMVTIRDRNHASSTDSNNGNAACSIPKSGNRFRRKLHKRSRPQSEHPDRAGRRGTRRTPLVVKGGT
jgi:hypothetical protein